MSPPPLGPADAIVAKRRFLYRQQDWDLYGQAAPRFFMKGVAFPNAPPPKAVTATPDNPHPVLPKVNYNATAWIDVLMQLRRELPSLNTVRLYEMDPSVHYDEFFQAAAQLRFYVLVPLTSVRRTDGILYRDRAAPDCYNSTDLYRYGVQSISNFGRFPNVLAGVIGNEVMNDLTSWSAAPCVKQYARDLQLYMSTATGEQRAIPLLYAAQHSGIGAALTEVDTIRLTVDYLTCREQQQDDDDDDIDDISIVGVNVESWCSSNQPSWRLNPNGSPGTYFQLDQGLTDGVTIPLVFSELGCSHAEFDHDSPTTAFHATGTRDWKQVPVVLRDMHARWSGFSAYAYWGNSLFAMMQNGPWNGRDVLEPAMDFRYFQTQLQVAEDTIDFQALQDQENNSENNNNNKTTTAFVPYHDLPLAAGGIMDDYYQQRNDQPHVQPTCQQVRDVLLQTARVDMLDLALVPSYHYQDAHPSSKHRHQDNNKQKQPEKEVHGEWMDLDDAIITVAESTPDKDMNGIDSLDDNMNTNNNNHDDDYQRGWSLGQEQNDDTGNSVMMDVGWAGLAVVALVLLVAVGMVWARSKHRRRRQDYEAII